MIGKGVGKVKFKLGDVEDWVNCAHRARETEGEGSGAGLGNDFEGTKELVGELPRGTSSSNVLGLEEHLISESEVRLQRSPSVGRSLIVLLGVADLNLELLMKFVQVHDKVAGARRSKIALGVDCDVQMIALISKEGRDASRSVRRVVVGKFGKGQKLRPVVLLVVAVHPKILFERLIDSFSLAVTFGMITRCKMKSHVESLA